MSKGTKRFRSQTYFSTCNALEEIMEDHKRKEDQSPSRIGNIRIATENRDYISDEEKAHYNKTLDTFLEQLETALNTYKTLHEGE